jgi:hypothetical protein
MLYSAGYLGGCSGLHDMEGATGTSRKRDPSKVADLIAEAVKAQWQIEIKRRRVFNPYALPVR